MYTDKLTYSDMQKKIRGGIGGGVESTGAN